jgi:hypothetical protein
MPMYSFSSRSNTSTFSVAVSIICCRSWVLGGCVRTVNHVEEHRRGQEGLWWEVDGEDWLRCSWSSSAEDMWTRWWRAAGIVHSSVACPTRVSHVFLHAPVGIDPYQQLMVAAPELLQHARAVESPWSAEAWR